MKFLILMPIFANVALSMSIPKEQEVQPLDVIRTGICYNQLPGATFPDLNNCSQFMMCMNRDGLILSRCPQNLPYFDHCISRCTSNRQVCSKVYCYSGTTTGTPPPWGTTTTSRSYTTMGTTTRSYINMGTTTSPLEYSTTRYNSA